MRTLSLLIALLHLPLTSLLVNAQDTQEISFKVYTWYEEGLTAENQKNIPELFYRQKEKYITVKFVPAELTPFFDATITNQTITLYKKVTLENQEITYEKVVSCKLPLNCKKAFLYLFYDENKPGIIPIDISSQSFKKSTFAFINTHSKPVNVTINGEQHKVVAKKIQKIPYKPNPKQTLRIVVTSTDTTPQNLAVMTVGIRPQQRLIGFFFPFANANSFRLLIERGVDNQAHTFKIEE